MDTLVTYFVCWVETAVVTVLNWVILALGSLWLAVVTLLPDMPAHATLPSFVVTAVGYMNYVLDVAWLVAWVGTFFGMVGAVFLVMIPLRWIKAAD